MRSLRSNPSAATMMRQHRIVDVPGRRCSTWPGSTLMMTGLCAGTTCDCNGNHDKHDRLKYPTCVNFMIRRLHPPDTPGRSRLVSGVAVGFEKNIFTGVFIKLYRKTWINYNVYWCRQTKRNGKTDKRMGFLGTSPQDQGPEGFPVS